MSEARSSGAKTMANKTGQTRSGRDGLKRMRLLGSGSTLAAAIAVASLGSGTAYAQSIPQMPHMDAPAHQRAPMVPGMPVRTNNNRAPVHNSVGVPRIMPSTIASEPMMIDAGATLNPPTVPDVSITPINAPVVSMITPQSSTPAPSPGDTDVDGVNVLATANFLGDQIDFRPGTVIDVVDVMTAQGIINWTTFAAGAAGTDVTFLGTGGNLEFTSTLADYTVLNRVFTPGVDSAIRIDGSVTSSVLGGGTSGGNIWFYSPGGIVVGPTGSFDVGSLLLTSSDVNSIVPGGQQMSFLGVAEAGTAVRIEAGATIDALNNGSYVAIVAPRIEQGGTVNVNGSSAYVAAEQAQLTINNGLFDITVGVGSADANGIVHSGTTTGAQSQGIIDQQSGQLLLADAQGIYMVAVAKNNAINMLVGGDIGFAAATGASVTDNGTIMLSAGAGIGVTGGTSDPAGEFDTDNATGGGSVTLTQVTLNSDTEIFASDAVDLSQNGLDLATNTYRRLTMGGDARGEYSLDVTAGNAINMGVANFGVIDISGDVTLGDAFSASGADISFVATSPILSKLPADPLVLPPADAGTVSVGGGLTINTRARGADDFFNVRNNGNTGIGEDATAGSIIFDVSGSGNVQIAGNLTLDASAQGGKGESVNGIAAAGDIDFTVSEGIVDIGGTLRLDAGTESSGFGKIGGSGPGSIGGDSFGGDVTIDISGGSVTAGFVTIDSDGRATSGGDETQIQSNDGFGGDVLINVTGGAHTFGDLVISAVSRDGSSYDANGDEVAGIFGRNSVAIGVSGTDSTLNITNDLSIDANSSGSSADPAGLAVSLTAQNTGTSGGFLIGDDVFIDTSSDGSNENEVNTAGSISVFVDGSTFSFDTMFADADSRAGNSGPGAKNSQGGNIDFTATGSGIISGRRAFLQTSASGEEGVGGDGAGGDITFLADNGRIAFTDILSVNASGEGGSGVDQDNGNEPGVGRGGTIQFTVTGAGGSMDFADLDATSDGSIIFDEEGGGAFGFGNGGSGIGGNIIFDIISGTFDADDVSISTDGFGGDGGEPLDDGIPPGGPTGIVFLGDTPGITGGAGLVAGPIALAPASVPALALVDPAPPTGLPKGGSGGDGAGGDVVFNLDGGTANVNSMSVTADGVGGFGAFSGSSANFTGGDGGSGIGGTATFNGNSGTLNVANDLNITANGNSEFGGGNGGTSFGSEGGDGGIATGGVAIFNMVGTANISADTVNIAADAFGGDGSRSRSVSGGADARQGGAGGSGTGGTAIFNNTSGDISFNALTVSSNSEGGSGGDSRGLSDNSATGNGGAGGAGIAGTATINLNQDDGSDPNYIVEATAVGGIGGEGLNSGNGGDAFGGDAVLNVNDSQINLTTVTIDSSAIGGNAGDIDAEGGDGGDGGQAIAGSSVLDVNGANAIFSSDSAITMRADAAGGAGAAGAPFANNGGGGTTAGMGGAGGNADAGSIQIIVRDGATADYQSDNSTTANATGGIGGDGGINTFDVNDQGDGGDAGTATGGSIQLIAQTGGTLNIIGSTGPATFSADAIGVGGGSGGELSFGLEGNNGANSETSGGGISLSASGTGSSIVGTSDFDATAQAIGFADTRRRSVGADATGGSFTIDVDGGAAISITDNIVFVGDAIGAYGLFNPGNATGGTADINVTDGSLTGAVLTISQLGFGSPGQTDLNGQFGPAGSGTGGDVNFTVGSSGTLDLGLLGFDVSGIGGDGVSGGSNASEGTGGNGTGGSASLSLAGDVDNLTLISIIANGSGGSSARAGPTGAAAAAGGGATGGTVVVNLTDTGADLPDLTGLVLQASATGGVGGVGGFGDSQDDGGTGGTGGNAQGGSASFEISGNGSVFDLDPTVISLTASGTGGSGGTGGFNVDSGAGGEGGLGGDGTGGEIAFVANSGATINLLGGLFSLSSDGQGGVGGFGGSSSLSAGGTGGIGGEGGVGRGGSPTLRAIGGTIQGADLELSAVGFGGDGGLGGDDGNGSFGADGAGGDGEGGTPVLEILDGSPGILDFQNVDLLANGVGGTGSTGGLGFGGLVTISDLSPDPLGLLNFGSLNVDATGLAAIPGGGFLMVGGSGPASVAGNVVVDVAGDIVYNFDGDGQLVAGGSVQLFAGDDIIVTHTNNTAQIVSIDAGGNFSGQAANDIDAQSGSILSGNELFLFASGDIAADDVRAVPGMIINAGGNVLINNAIATGPQGFSNFGGITIDAGRDPIVGAVMYDNDTEARITGTVDSYANIVIRSGGNAVFETGSDTIASDRLSVQTGDDIIVESGATLSSARNPTFAVDPNDPFNGTAALSLDAGGLPNLLSVPITPIASIVIGGTLDANGGAIIANANAIDGLDGTMIGGSISLDVRDAPNNGVAQSNDAGLLSGNCLEGVTCIGNIEADNVISIGQGSNNDTIRLFIEQGTVNANDILITIREDIVMGTDGIATTLNASNLFSATSVEGNIDLRDTSIGSAQILIDAAGSLLGSGSLSSTNDIGISVGDSLAAGTIDTGGELTEVGDVGGAAEEFYSVSGSIDIGSLSVGVGDVNYDADGSINLDSVSVPGTNINLVAGNSASIGFTDSPGSISIDASAIDLGAIVASDEVDLFANGGQISVDSLDTGGMITMDGGDITGGSIAGGDIDAFAIGAFDVSDVFAGGFVNIDAGTIFSNSVQGSDVTASASNIFLNFVSGNSVGLFGGSIFVGVGQGGSIDLDGDFITVDQINADFATLTSVDSVDVRTQITVTDDIQIFAGGAVTGGDLDAGNMLQIDADDIAIGNGSAPIIDLTSANDILFDGLTSPNAITLSAVNGAIGANTGSGDIDSGGAVDLAAQSIDIGDITSGGSVIAGASDGDAAFGTVDAADDITISATGNPSVVNAISGGDTSITGAAITFDNGTIGGDLSLEATNGDIDGNGAVSVGGAIGFVATGGVGFGSLNARGGDFTVDAGDDIVFTDATSAQDVAMLAGGFIDGDTIDAGASAQFDAGGAITIDHAEATDDFIANAGGNFTTGLNSIITGGDINISGDVVDLGNSTAGGLIDVVGTQIDFAALIAGLTIDLETVLFTAQGVPGTGDSNITGVDVTATNGGVTLTSLGSIALSGTAQISNGDFFATADGGIDFNVTNLSGTLDFDADGSVFGFGTVMAQGDVLIDGFSISLVFPVSGDDIELSSSGGGGINASSLDAAGRLVIDAGIGGFNGATLDAGGAINIDSNGDVGFFDAHARLNLLIDTINGDVSADTISSDANVLIDIGGELSVGAVSAAKTGQGSVQINADDGIDMGTLSGNAAELFATNGDVRVDQEIDVTNVVEASGLSIFLRATNDLQVRADATAGDVDILTDGTLNVRGASAPGNIDLTSTGGSTTVNEVFIAGSTLPPGTQSPQQITSSGGNITITGATDVVVNADVTAANNLSIDAGDLLDIQATASGDSINLVADDVNIASTGALGRSDETSDIAISSRGDIQLGGAAGTSTGFEIDGDEFSRIFSGGDVLISAVGFTTGEGNMTIGDLTATVGTGAASSTDGTIGSGGSLFLTADESVSVLGNATVTGAGADNLFAIDAIGQIVIDADTGNLRVEDANGGIIGNIGLTAQSVIAATTAAQADIPNLTVSELDQLLGQTASNVRDEGFIQANDLSITVNDAVLIQNSGAGDGFDDRRGFTVNSITIDSLSGSSTGGGNPITIVINGTVAGNTGIDALNLVGAPANFDANSTVNGCLLIDPSSCVVVTGSSSGDQSDDNPLQDLIDDQVGPDANVDGGSPDTMIVEFREDPERQPDPLIDEPVTGAGNEDLWVDEEECGETDGVCPGGAEQEAA